LTNWDIFRAIQGRLGVSGVAGGGGEQVRTYTPGRSSRVRVNTLCSKLKSSF